MNLTISGNRSVRIGKCLVICGHHPKEITTGTVLKAGKRRSWVTYKTDYYDEGQFLFRRNEIGHFRNSRIIMLAEDNDES